MLKKQGFMKQIYFDYAATTPVDPLVKAAMAPYFSEKFGNPGSLHFFGQEAMAAVDFSRETIAKAIGADFHEIIFTGSATEANNLALRGITEGFRHQALGIRNEKNKNLAPSAYGLVPRIIISAIEHESILETAKDLENEGVDPVRNLARARAPEGPLGRAISNGVEVIYLPVNKTGLVDLKKLESSLNERTILVSIMSANNEIGTIQPIAEISKLISEFRKKKVENRNNENSNFYFLDSRFPLFHTDAVQAFQFLDCDAEKLGIDLMTLSAHKIYGPKGVGALYLRGTRRQALGARNENNKFLKPSAYSLAPITTGGGQEFGFRSGTENVAAIAGFAKAVELASQLRKKESKRIGELKDYFWRELKKVYPPAQINADPTRTNAEKIPRSSASGPRLSAILPNILNIYFPGHSADNLLIKLDMAGVAASAGSACSVRSVKPSHVLTALGLAPERIRASVRFGFGRFTTKKEIYESVRRIKKILGK